MRKFQAAADAREAEGYAGMGVQSLLEHMLVTDGDLEETWAWWRYKKIFPKQEDLERYLTGQPKEPESAADLTPRWLVRGRMVGSKAVSVPGRALARAEVAYPRLATRDLGHPGSVFVACLHVRAV